MQRARVGHIGAIGLTKEVHDDKILLWVLDEIVRAAHVLEPYWDDEGEIAYPLGSRAHCTQISIYSCSCPSSLSSVLHSSRGTCRGPRR